MSTNQTASAFKIELSDRWGISHRTLERWRWTGEGPVFILSGIGIMEDSVESGDCPTRNWRGSGTRSFPSASFIGGDSVIALRKSKYGCFRCPLACGGHMHASTPESEYEYGSTHKPEYETLAAFGALCLNDNLPSLLNFPSIASVISRTAFFIF